MKRLHRFSLCRIIMAILLASAVPALSGCVAYGGYYGHGGYGYHDRYHERHGHWR